MRLLKRIFQVLALLLITFLLYNISAVSYGLQQGIGQAKLLWSVREIDEMLEDPSVEDSVKQKFQLIAAIKKFSDEQLGLSKTDNYTTFYNQKGKPILWTVKASPEFKIEAYKWEFPIAGSFPYKGFFDLEKAKKEENKLKEQGFDTDVNEVSAWSTLGWFRDPILSSMLERSPGRLAELIIHESTHATIYIKDSAQFNENLASFIGRKGADQFLAFHYGVNSTERINYQKLLKRKEFFRNYMQEAIVNLSEKYQGMDTTLSMEQKRQLKAKWVMELKDGLAKSRYYDNDSLAAISLKEFQPNNAYFSGFNTYADEIPILEKQLKQKFNGDLKAMILSFKSKGLSL